MYQYPSSIIAPMSGILICHQCRSVAAQVAGQVADWPEAPALLLSGTPILFSILITARTGLVRVLELVYPQLIASLSGKSLISMSGNFVALMYGS